MTSLTRVSIVARKVIRYGTYLLIFGIILRFTILFGADIYRQINPADPPDPTVPFDNLPELPFPIKEVPNELSYELILPDEELPEFPQQVNVYEMPKIQTNIRVLEDARSKASRLGFNGETGQELVESVYVFEHREEPSRLTMNIVNGIFSISYDVRSNLSILGRLPPSKEEAEKEIRSLLNRSGITPEDLTGPVTHQFLSIADTGFIEAISRSDADIIKVNFFRMDYEENMPSMTPEALEANVWFYMGGESDRSDAPIVGGEYHYYPINQEVNGTYPIKSSQEAWDELTNGGGYIANLGDNGNSITIRRVYLAYYDAGQYTPYFQPIVVFEGDNDFYAYVPAIENTFYGTDEEQSEE